MTQKKSKLSVWFRARTMQELLMLAAICMLLIMIATRWRYIGHTAASAFRNRFVRQTEQTIEPMRDTVDQSGPGEEVPEYLPPLILPQKL